MQPLWILLILTALQPWAPAADGCEILAGRLKFPVKLKTRGKPPRARWEQVDAVVTQLRNQLQGKQCEFTFQQVFRSDRTELYFPLTNNLVRTVPEEALKGLKIYGRQGEDLGQYQNRVVYEKSGGLYARQAYSLYYFQFLDLEGQLQSTGNRLLLDDFLVRWEDLKARVLISTTTDS